VRLLANDPGHRALRRAARAALILPATLFVALQLPFISQGALLAAFSCLSQTLFADFGGPKKRRLIAYLATTAAGVPLIIAGTAASTNLPASVAMAFVVALIVGLLAVLRGVIAAAQTVLLLATVLALTAVPVEHLWPSVAAWVFGGLVAATAAVTLWPLESTRPIQRRIADVLDAIADACQARWIDDDLAALKDARVRSTEALTALHSLYDGNLQRPSGVTESDRALAELVDEVGRLRYLQRWEDLSPQRDPHLAALMATECRQVADSLRRCAQRLRGARQALSSQALMDLRRQNLDDMAQWLADRQLNHPSTSDLRAELDDAFPLRITTLVASRITDLTITATPRKDDVLTVIPDAASSLAPASARQRIASHLSWESPWFRNAARTAVALSISVAVAKSVSLEHPFWIVLGTLSALRFDALGTGRQAWQALVGTTAGVAIAAGVLTVVGDRPPVWWALLPVVVFIAAYTPGTMSFAAGQAAFTVTVIVLFSIIEPSGIELVEARWLDVILGLAISLIVSLLMWPRGVLESLYKRLGEAMTNACDYYVATTDWIADGAIDDRLLDGFEQRSRQSLDRAREALDLSIVQRPPETIALQRWTALANTIRHVDFAARLAPQTRVNVSLRGGKRVVPLALVGPLLTCSNDVRRRLDDATAVWATQREATTFDPRLPDFEVAESVALLRAAIDSYLANPEAWDGDGPDPRPVIVTWLTDWCALFDESAQVLSQSTA
jgi:uncharacterized membrane protein YccC